MAIIRLLVVISRVMVFMSNSWRVGLLCVGGRRGLPWEGFMENVFDDYCYWLFVVGFCIGLGLLDLCWFMNCFLCFYTYYI